MIYLIYILTFNFNKYSITKQNKFTFENKFEFAQQIRGLFLRFFADLFKNYANFIK